MKMFLSEIRFKIKKCLLFPVSYLNGYARAHLFSRIEEIIFVAIGLFLSTVLGFKCLPFLAEDWKGLAILSYVIFALMFEIIGLITLRRIMIQFIIRLTENGNHTYMNISGSNYNRYSDLKHYEYDSAYKVKRPVYIKGKPHRKIKMLTIKKIEKLNNIIQKDDNATAYWGRLSDHFLFGNDGLLFCGYRILYKDIAGIHLDVILTEDTYQFGYTYGKKIIAIKMKKSKMVIELPISGVRESIHYYMEGKNVVFQYDKLLKDTICAMEKVVKGEYPNLSFYKNAYRDVMNKRKKAGEAHFSYSEYREKRREEEEARRILEERIQAERWGFSEYYKSGRFHHYHRDNGNCYGNTYGQSNSTGEKQRENDRKFQCEHDEKTNSQTNHNSNQKNKTVRVNKEFENANIYFCMKLPFSSKELKDRRNELIKKVHPDEGGSNKMAAQINASYHVLRKYCECKQG